MSTKKLLLITCAVTALLLAGTAVKLARHTHTDTPSPASSTEPKITASRAPATLTVGETVYDGKLATGWADWGWGPHDLSNGPARIVFQNYGGIIFRRAALDATFGAISFRYKAPADWPDFLTVSLRSATTRGDKLPNVAIEARHTATLSDGWREVLVELSELDPEGFSFDRIVLSARSQVASDWILVDKVVLAKRPAASTGTAPRRTVQLAILCRTPGRAINPLIYGSAQGDWTSGQTAQRLGGNPATRANWDLGVTNTASDWFFENGKGADLQQFLGIGLEHRAYTALTVPIIGWVAKDAVSVGFPRSRFADQRKYDPNRPEAGDGHRADGSLIQPGPPTQTSMPAPPELIGRWIRALRDRDRARGARSVQMYILDNEPSLWNETHHDLHPEPLGYDELLDRTLRYATEIRKADPDAQIAGPAEWGFLGYMYSGRDRAAGTLARPDRLAHGDMPLIPWYLQRIAEHEKSTGLRLLDVLDVHFYPAASGIHGENARTDPDGAALRLRSTRALWDPSYNDESWIKEPVRLIPRLKEWVATYHPGLHISLGEWSFGADQDISGALATAEALGRFGQHGLDSAFYWDGPKAGSATYWAFRAFRNFDGRGARFQDISLATTEADTVSLFASRDAAGTTIVAILLNRHPTIAASAELRLEGCGRILSHREFSFVSGSSGLLAQPPSKEDGATLPVSLPPYSLTVLDIQMDATH